MSSLQTSQKLLGGFGRQLLGIRLSRGEVKIQRQLPVDISDVFSIIDAMPMRQREIRERSEETLSEEGAESALTLRATREVKLHLRSLSVSSETI